MEASGWGRDKWQFFCNFDNARLNFRPLPACLAGTQELKLVFHFDTTAPLPSSPGRKPSFAALLMLHCAMKVPDYFNTPEE